MMDVAFHAWGEKARGTHGPVFCQREKSVQPKFLPRHRAKLMDHRPPPRGRQPLPLRGRLNLRPYKPRKDNFLFILPAAPAGSKLV